MDVLTTILTCSLYLADDSLVRAIAESSSQRNPYFVLDTSIERIVVDPPAPPKSASEAIARTTDILANGGRPVLGLMQVPPLWMSVFGRELADAFDPCTNIAVGTAMLSQFDSECAAQGRRRPRRNRARRRQRSADACCANTKRRLARASSPPSRRSNCVTSVPSSPRLPMHPSSRPPKRAAGDPISCWCPLPSYLPIPLPLRIRNRPLPTIRHFSN